MNLLTAEMLNRNLVELDTLNVLGDFLFDFFGRRIVLKRELANFILDKRGGVIRQATTAKDYGTHNVGSPVTVLVPLVAVNGKAYLIILFQRVHLLAGLCTVEVDFVVLLIVVIIYRDRKGIAVVAVHCQHAPPGLLQQVRDSEQF